MDGSMRSKALRPRHRCVKRTRTISKPGLRRDHPLLDTAGMVRYPPSRKAQIKTV